MKVAPDPTAEVEQCEAEPPSLELRECAVRDQEAAQEEEGVDGEGAAEDELPPDRKGASIFELQIHKTNAQETSKFALNDLRSRRALFISASADQWLTIGPIF